MNHSNRWPWASFAFLLSSFACGSEPSKPAVVAPSPPSSTTTASAAVPPALSTAPVATPPGLAWVEDDFARAREQAKREGKWLFVDAWAPWCHSCVSLRAFVLADPMLAPLSKEYVFASLDTERTANASFAASYPLRVWPTLYVIDPTTDKEVLRWEGTLTADELGALLPEVRRIGLAGGKPPPIAALMGVDADPRKLEAYLREHPEPGVLRDHLVDVRVSSLCRPAPVGPNGKREKRDECVCAKVALEEMPRMTDGTAKWTVLATALGGLAGAPKGLSERVVGEAEKVLASPSARVHGDDVSGVFEALVEHYEETKQVEKKKALASKWATFLEGEAARAKTPAARSVFDAHRLGAYLALGEAARAIPMLEESARALPGDYNPHARLARVYKELDRADDALREIELAKKVGYGPRMLRVASLGADIRMRSGDRAGAAREIEEALARVGDAPLSGSYKKLAAELKARREALAK